jgi:hypothetical protein
VLALVREIAAIAGDDGIDYDLDGASAETIRDGDECPGPVEVPRLLGGSITVLGYPLTMILAEKIVTGIERGTANTRWRDYADVYLLTGQRPVDGTEMERSLRMVAQHRGATMMPLSEVLHGYAEIAQARWAAWVRKLRLDDRLPSRFAQVLDAVGAFAEPVLEGRTAGLVRQRGRRSWGEG